MKLSVVIPYRPSDPSRAENLAVVKGWLSDVFPPDVEILCADDPNPDFNRGRAINAGVARTDGDLLAFVDADLIVSGEVFLAGLRAAENGAAMVVPFVDLVALNGAASTRVRTGADAWGPWEDEDIQYRWDQRPTGCVNLLTRRTFEDAGGFDPRFAGWGFEDSAFGDAVETLVGPIIWLPGTAIHLWHPLDPTRSGPLPAASAELCKRYTAAWGDKDAMRALIDSR